MKEEFLAKEFGVAGEMLTPRAAAPQGKPQPPLIPPPPWSENYDPELDPDHESASEPEEREP
jgi:hypothetical protein